MHSLKERDIGLSLNKHKRPPNNNLLGGKILLSLQSNEIKYYW